MLLPFMPRRTHEGSWTRRTPADFAANGITQAKRRTLAGVLRARRERRNTSTISEFSATQGIGRRYVSVLRWLVDRLFFEQA